MATETNYKDIIFNCAAQMLEIEVTHLPESLKRRLIAVDELVQKCNPVANLHSTQVIASIIVAWQADEYLETELDHHCDNDDSPIENYQ